MSGAVQEMDGGGGAPAGAPPLYPLLFGSRKCWDEPENVRNNIIAAVKRKLTPFFICPLVRPETMVVVGNSFTLSQYLIEVRDRQTAGGKVFAINQAHDYLIESGTIPDYCLTLDSCQELASVITPHPDVVYMPASMSHPDYLDGLEGFRTILWHAWNNADEEGLLGELGEKGPIIKGGSTATIRALNVGYLMGFRKFAFYGTDSSYGPGGEYYAHESNYKNPFPQSDALVVCKGRYFPTNVAFAAQAADFAVLFDSFARDCDIQAYGEGLIPWMCEHLNRRKSEILRTEAQQKDS